MKNYVKRGIASEYISSQIHIENITEWTYLTLGIDELIKQAEISIDRYNKNLIGYKQGDFSSEILTEEYCLIRLNEEKDRLKNLEKIREDLQVANECKG
jgi:hypothetical protein